ncbi:DUF4097 family beta strand repeat-containing protein [Mucilaginibacter sp. L3T2-6]|uniref:DUF4097 family beta strand repeat-containing protein n=1 Tax=Mucilaginibacter sp. L3T2-6 TaxID=3062491 RepID=UPI00267524AB|nr:DUF4097 family beta strand repeat-containing protein [Mucilaginibacter sp. L3T2-6]MDO3643254.1 DUF4097 family beta strand repeat-containing protein [Mucilaginibacter sp. L3T2-6]MDV6215578.1 DUF4097 family beta strand repeat-containing protein [Mucilaginibacter sp. L3T2-6]
MKTIKIIGALAVAMLIYNGLYAQTAEKEQLVVPLSQPGRPYKLDVGIVDGSITVIGYEGKDIIIETKEKDRGERQRNQHTRDGMHSLSTGRRADIQANENNNTVTVEGEAGRETNLVLKVPQGDAALKLQTVNNGDILVSNINGDLELTNTNGGIKATGISGSVVANTVNGNVIVTFKSIDPKAAMAFTTLNGNVDVTFPPSLKANVKLKSDRGDIFTDFDVVAEEHKPTVSNKSTPKGKMYSLKVEDWVYGKINGGGPQLMMKNMNGNLYIRKVK